MAYHIIWKNSDDSVKVTNMHPTATLEETTTHKDILISRGETSIFQTVLSSEQLPQDRYFRNAWRCDASTLRLDLSACKERHLNKLRRIRNIKLQASDADFMQALEQNDAIKLTVLKAYRQALRDMPQATAVDFANATTPDTIKAIQPAILNAIKP